MKTGYANPFYSNRGHWILRDARWWIGFDSRKTSGEFNNSIVISPDADWSLGGNAYTVQDDVFTALVCDGNGDYIRTLTETDLEEDADGTFAYWFKTDTLTNTNGATIPACDNDTASAYHRSWHDDDGSVRFAIYDNPTWYTASSAAGLVTVGQWHHYAATWSDANGMAVYLDGVKRGTNAHTGTSTVARVSFSFGCPAATALLSYGFKGRMAQCMMWHRELAEEEIFLLGSRKDLLMWDSGLRPSIVSALFGGGGAFRNSDFMIGV